MDYKNCHKPIMTQEVMRLGEFAPGMLVVDGTTGMGGHSKLFADVIGSTGELFCLDRDEEALKLAQINLSDTTCKIKFIHSNYSEMKEAMDRIEVNSVDRIFLDIGVSSLHLNKPERGFSFMNDGPLDMRMDRSKGSSAADLIATLSEAEMADLFYQYGEEHASRRIARSIAETRVNETINTTGRLAEIISSSIGRRGRLHPATKVFQALRIVVNDELGELDKGLDFALELLKSGGRVLVITFHSLEDRMVKFRFRNWKEQGLAKILTKKVVKPTYAEKKGNPRARSAKLRVAEKI